MLKIAKLYEEQLQDKFRNTVFLEKCKFFNASNYYSYDIELDNNSWNKIEMVSIDENEEILGYFHAKIDRTSDAVNGLAAMNFGEMNYQFSRDFHKFITELFTIHNFRKMSFAVIVGNPAEKMYDKYINRYGGRVVGIFKDDVRLFDSKFYDHKHYEIFKEDYLQRLK